LDDLVAVFQAALIDPTSTNATILRCTRVHHRQRDGLRGATQYDVDVGHPDEASPVRTLVTTLSLGGNRTRRLWHQLVQSGRAGIIDASGLRAFAYVPHLDLLVQVFPHDARLPALEQMVPAPSPAIAAVLNQDRARTFSGNGGWTGGSTRYRPDMRATVQLDAIPGDETPEPAGSRYFAKVYREPEQARHASTVQAALFQACDPGSSTLQVARPLPLDLALNTLLTQAVPGVSLEQRLKRGGELDQALWATARAIAELHRLPVLAPPRPIAMELAQARQAGDLIIEAAPDLAPLVTAILDPISDALQNAPIGFIHGDLKPEHVVVSETADLVSVLDFDLCAAGDPILDIAHFLAFLGKPSPRSRAQTAQTLSPGQVFLDAYFTHAPGIGRARIGCYHAITALHKAAGLCRSPGDDAGDQAAAVLDEGLRYLTGDVDEAISPSFRRRMTRTI
jgi:hypothetical protein